MNTIWMIATGTFGEAIRRKILNVFLFVAIAMIVMGFAFSSLQPGEEMTVVKSLGLGVIALAGVFISVILFINLIPLEIERRTIYTILSKPVQRYEFLCGKFLGGMMTVLLNIGLMGLAFIALLVYKEHGWDHDITEAGKGVIMIFFQMMLLGGVSMCFSVLVSPFVNFFLSFAVWMLGSMSSVTEALASDPQHKKNPVVVGLFKLLHYVLIPNFGNFNIQNPIIHPDIIVHNETAYLFQNVLYALCWTGVLMLIAVLAFDRREV
jgi:ABC-type transport system involved in multi-copper enzyme maturation permease subunit